jgi:hypothetical protein
MGGEVEQSIWQRRAARMLVDLLEWTATASIVAGKGMRLGAITWTVNSAGCSLVGRVDCYPLSARRALFGAWRDAITENGRRPDVDREIDVGHSIRLVAQWEQFHRCRVSLMADIDITDETAELEQLQLAAT